MFFRETYFQGMVLQIMHQEMGYSPTIAPKDIEPFKAISKAVQKAGGEPYEAALQIRFWILRKELDAPYPLMSAIEMIAELIPLDPKRCKHQMSLKNALEDLNYIRQRCSEQK